MAITYAWTDGNWTVASPVTKPEFIRPLPRVAAAYVLRQEFMQLSTSFAALPFNTPHPDYSSYYLVSESEPRDLGNGVLRWTRTYAQVPVSHDEWETFGFNVIGITGSFGINITPVTGRDRRVFNVNSRVQNDYFLVNPMDSLLVGPWEDGKGNFIQTMLTPGAIPVIRAFQYCYTNVRLPVDYIADATTPTTTDYNTLCANVAKAAVYDPWSVDVCTQVISPAGNVTMPLSLSNMGQIAPDDSRLEQWMGQIFVRRTRYVLAY